jgi:drug/metabolite transporter (DMT)-like permease
LIGALAIPLWATWPLLASLTTAALPLFQYLAMIFAVGAAILLALPRPPAAKRHPGIRSSVSLTAIMVAIGLLVSDIFFILALRRIPPAQANLILYLWPVLVVLMATALRLVRLRWRHFAGVALGLAGAAIVMNGSIAGLSWTGAGLAFAGGFTWAGFVAFRLWQGDGAPEALGFGLAFSAAIALALHLALESWSPPTLSDVAGTFAVGAVPLALGNLAWDHGVRKGDHVLLATLAYATPLVSALLLVAAGLAAPTFGLAASALLIVAAGVIAGR